MISYHLVSFLLLLERFLKIILCSIFPNRKIQHQTSHITRSNFALFSKLFEIIYKNNVPIIYQMEGTLEIWDYATRVGILSSPGRLLTFVHTELSALIQMVILKLYYQIFHARNYLEQLTAYLVLWYYNMPPINLSDIKFSNKNFK